MADVKYDWEKMEKMKLSGTHQGGLKTLGECQAGTGAKGEEFPGNIIYSSKREKKNKKGTNKERS